MTLFGVFRKDKQDILYSKCVYNTYFTAAILKFFLNPGLAISVSSLLFYCRLAYMALQKSLNDKRNANSVSNVHSVQFKITKMLTLVMGLYYLCYFPPMIIHSFNDKLGNYESFSIIQRCSTLLWYTAAMINPIIYGWMNKDFNVAFCSMLHLKNKVHSITVTSAGTLTLHKTLQRLLL